MPEPTPARKARMEQVDHHRLRGVVLVLENIHDPHNAAAIMRSAESFGVDQVWLIMEEVEPWDPELIGKKSSAHANKWMHFEIFETTADCLDRLKRESFTCYGTMLDADAVSIETADFHSPEKLALIMGNEKEGLTEAIQQALNQKIIIPMYGFTQSLNVSVAAALCLWELGKQRRSFSTGKTVSRTV